MMAPQEYARIQSAFLRIRKLSVEARELETAKLGESERREVLSLLAADDRSDGFLGMEDEASPDQHPEFEMRLVPKQIGEYRLLQKLGEGGVGAVYMAEQTEPVYRKVALKLIKPGMNSRQVLARFQAERQALAMMSHPSIAQFFDVGTTDDGLPYFVMELVQGTPIDRFCDDNSLATDERLALFSQVCDAVHHAHRKGIIHRDLKPSNILVSLSEEKPVPKVIDFGIAKAFETRLTDATLFTEVGQMVGTLEYMSPEQAEMSTVDIDTRSDVYALGVLLYRLLTGSTPISRDELLKNGLFDLPRVMRDAMPPKPSDRVAALRRHHPRVENANLQQFVRGELDWITLKCLAKDRCERYDSTRDLADDIRRYLVGHPVSAHPPTLRYRLRKFAQRNLAVTLVSLVVVASLLLGLVGLGLGWQQAAAGRKISEESRTRLNEQMYAEMINLAWLSTRRSDPGRAVELLDACAPELRGWEWNLVHSEAMQSQASAIRQSGKSAVTDLAVSGDGTQLGVSLADGTVELRAADSDRRIAVIESNSAATSIAMHGDRLVVGAADGSLSWYGTSVSKLIRIDVLRSGSVYDVQFSSSGEHVVASTGMAALHVVETSTGNVKQSWELPGRVSEVCFLDENLIVGAGLDGMLYFVELGKPEVRNTLVSGSNLTSIRALVRQRVCVLERGSVLLIDTNRPDAMPTRIAKSRSPGATPEIVTCLATKNDGALWCSGRGAAKYISFSSQAESGPSEPSVVAELGVAMTAAVWDDQKDRFVCGLADGRIVSLPVRSRCKESFAASNRPGIPNVNDVQFDPKESLVFFATDNGHLQICETAESQSGEMEPVVEKKLHEESIWNIATDRERKTLVSVGEDFLLRCWELPSLELRFEAAIQYGARDVCISPDATWIAAAPKYDAGETEGTIGIWDAATGSQTCTLAAHRNWVLALTVTADGRRLVSASEDRTVRVWRTQTWKVLHVIEPAQRAPASHLAFGKEDNVFLGHRDGWVTEWSLVTGRQLGEWVAFGDALSSLRWLDGRVVVTSRSSSFLKVYDTARAKLVAEIDLAQGPIQSFMPNEDFYLWSGYDGSRMIRRFVASQE